MECFCIEHGGGLTVDAGLYGGSPARVVRLRMLTPELLYDVANAGWIEGHKVELAAAEGAEGLAHLLADVAEGGNLSRVARVLELAHAEAMELLRPLSVALAPKAQGAVAFSGASRHAFSGASRHADARPDCELTDSLALPEQWVWDLSVPAGMSATTVRLIARLVHEYMVGRVLSDWLSLAGMGEAAAVWGAKAAEAAEGLTAAKSSRTGGMLRRMHPF